ncbi:MAG: adenosylcobinamide-phosphate synthase [Paracoccaceae bacterium]|jgi:adenosylcobinamide-phosphate synthase
MPISPDWFYGSDYLFAVLCAALALEFLLGGLPGFSHVLSFPRTLSVMLAHRADRRLNRQNRSSRSRRMRGALLVLILVPLSAIFGLYAAEFCRSLADGWIVETILVAMCVGLQRPLLNAGALRRALARKSLERARDILGRVVDYETDNIDEHGLARGSVEIFAVRLCDGLVGPVFWYVIAGLPGVFVYCVTTALADALSHPTEKHAAFGGVAGALDRLMNLIPAPVTAMLIVVGTLFAPTARPLAAIRGIFGGAASGQSPRAGWTQGAVAGALGLSLSGPRRHDGAVAPGAWIGDGRARANATDIARAMWLYVIAGFLGVVPLVLLALVAQYF